MFKHVKAKWLEALRSDKFKQGRERLCNIKEEHKQYCCLGILAEIVDPTRSTWDYSDSVFARVDRDHQCKLIGTGLTVNETSTLILMNDGRGSDDYHLPKSSKPFTVIADWIEQNIQEDVNEEAAQDTM